MPWIQHAKRFMSGLLVAAAVISGHAARADATLWYNGDFNGVDSLINGNNTDSGIDGHVYDNFVVPTGSVWTVSSVFSRDMVNPELTSYFPPPVWEIRSGVSAGNGGTLLGTGGGNGTTFFTGNTQNVGGVIWNEIQFQVTGLNVTLNPGTYWLMVAPNYPGFVTFDVAISMTSGANAIGTPPGNDGNSFFNSNFFGDNFTPTNDPSVLGPGTWDFSMGVIGVSQVSNIPEPATSTIVLVVGSLAGILALRRRTANP